jgi:UAA transporter family
MYSHCRSGPFVLSGSIPAVRVRKIWLSMAYLSLTIGEGLFYTHFLSVPAFALLYKDLGAQIVEYNNSPPISITSIAAGTGLEPLVPYLSMENVMVPMLWVYLFFNVATQCIRS